MLCFFVCLVFFFLSLERSGGKELRCEEEEGDVSSDDSRSRECWRPGLLCSVWTLEAHVTQEKQAQKPRVLFYFDLFFCLNVLQLLKGGRFCNVDSINVL